MRRLTKTEIEALRIMETPMRTAHISNCIYLLDSSQRRIVIDTYNALQPDYAAQWGSEKAKEGTCQRCWLRWVKRIAEVYYNQSEDAGKVHKEKRNHRKNGRG